MPETFDVDFEPDVPTPAPAALPGVSGNYDAPPPEVIDAQVDAQVRPVRRNLPAVRSPQEQPHSDEAEEYLLSAILIDGADSIDRCERAGLAPSAFFSPANRIIFECLQSLHARKQPLDAAILAEELKRTNRLNDIGGFAYIAQVSSRIPTTAQLPYFIERVSELSRARAIIAFSSRLSEVAQNPDALLDELAKARSTLDTLSRSREPLAPAKRIFDFAIPEHGDDSILLGDRYLNRGDGAVISSTSGMGKSSICLQMATLYALGQPAFGIRPNKALRSLIIQSEDSEGDVAEVAHSIRHALNLSEPQLAEVNDRVRIVTDRVNRGARFLASLRQHIEQHKPDLVWINPLQAFMDGDVTDSQDLGAFLREGLNALNEPARFGYVIVHHTTKPATGKERTDRQWHEVMYDMAGGAEIINWARAILSLRATPTEGEFNLVLAKRGRRAGVTKEVEQGAGTRLEPVTKIPLKHAKGRISIPGLSRQIPLIFWEPREEDAPEEPAPKPGRPKKYDFVQFKDFFPKAGEPHLPLNQIYAKVKTISEISRSSFGEMCESARGRGEVERIVASNTGAAYRLTS